MGYKKLRQCLVFFLFGSIISNNFTLCFMSMVDALQVQYYRCIYWIFDLHSREIHYQISTKTYNFQIRKWLQNKQKCSNIWQIYISI